MREKEKERRRGGEEEEDRPETLFSRRLIARVAKKRQTKGKERKEEVSRCRA